MKNRSSTHPLRTTMANPLQRSPVHQPGQTRELLLSSHLRPIRVFSLSQGTNYRSICPLCKSSFTERPVNQGDSLFKMPTSHHITYHVATVSIYQNHWTKCVVTPLSSLQQLSAAVLTAVYNHQPLPKVVAEDSGPAATV